MYLPPGPGGTCTDKSLSMYYNGELLEYNSGIIINQSDIYFIYLETTSQKEGTRCPTLTLEERARTYVA